MPLQISESDRETAAKDSAALSESAYLAKQAADAKAAFAGALHQIAGQFGQGVDPRVWTKRYPLAALGVSAAAGFVATALLVPSREQRALNKLAEIERALNPPPPPKPGESAAGQTGEQNFKQGRQSFTTAILTELIGAIKPAVISLLTAGVTAATAKPSEEEMENAAAAEDAKPGNSGADSSGQAGTPPLQD